MKFIKRIIPRSFLVRDLSSGASDSVLLTFDDGPHPDVTPAVLERLRKFKSRAVFFIVGRRIEHAPDILHRILEEGHIIGNHSFIHSNRRQPGFFHYLRDLERCQDLIEKHSGVRPILFRPPLGRITATTILAPRIAGLRSVSWSIEANDWRCKNRDEARKASRELIERIAPRDIVLLHDDNPRVLDILDEVLPRISVYDLNSGVAFI